MVPGARVPGGATGVLESAGLASGPGSSVARFLDRHHLPSAQTARMTITGNDEGEMKSRRTAPGGGDARRAERRVYGRGKGAAPGSARRSRAAWTRSRMITSPGASRRRSRARVTSDGLMTASSQRSAM